MKMLEVCRAYEYANHHKQTASSTKAQTHKKIGREPSHQIKNTNQVYQNLEPWNFKSLKISNSSFVRKYV